MTLTAVRPPARFGAIKITNNNKVKYFKEKSSIDEGWINGGFFVIEPEIFKYIDNDKTYLERGPLERIADLGKLVAFKHNGFWQCMDTLRDKEILEKNKKNLELKKNKILIAGGTGFIGYHLAKKCLNLKWSVVSISTKSPIKKRRLKDVKYLKLDISQKNY